MIYQDIGQSRYQILSLKEVIAQKYEEKDDTTKNLK
jgi:hypothetical protein|nr:MAG TPA: hypothetical protein [Caudoviricetes sp.]